MVARAKEVQMERLKLGDVACIIRTFNYAPGMVADAIRRALANGVGRIILVMDCTDSRRDEAFHRVVIRPFDQSPPGRITPIRLVRGEGPIRGFNLAVIGLERVWREQRGAFWYVLSASPAVEWTPEHVAAMKASLDERYGAVGTTFAGVRGQGRDPWYLGRMYDIPRFAFMLMRWPALQRVGCLCEGTDRFGGMEEIEFAVRLWSRAGWRIQQCNLRIPFYIDESEDPAQLDARDRAAAQCSLEHLSRDPANDDARDAVEELGVCHL